MISTFCLLSLLALPATDTRLADDPALVAIGAAYVELLGQEAEEDRVWFLQHYIPAVRERSGDERLLNFLEMFSRDLPGAVVRRARRLDGARAELTLYSAKTDNGAILTLAVEAEPPYRFEMQSAQLVHGDPVVEGVRAGMTADEIAETVERWVDGLAEAGRFSGAVLVARDGEVVFEKAWGLASHRFDVPNRTTTKFNLGSMNKMFTAVAIAQLVEAGKLDFDDALIEHLPDYPNPAVAEQVTIHHLLTHTSGLGDFWGAMFETDWTRLRTPADHLPLFAEDDLLFEPGARFSYSNAGFLVLGLVIEAVSGQSYYDYVREHVFAPAGMTDTDSWAMDEPVKNLAMGYTRAGADGHPDPDAPLRSNVFLHRARGGPAGGGFSTVGDLLAFSNALLGGELLGIEQLDLVFTGKVASGFGPGARYAYGFSDRLVEGNRVVGHSGGAPGINGVLGIFPEDGWTFAVLANIDDGASRVADGVQEMIGRADE